MSIFDYKEHNNSQVINEALIVHSYAWKASGETVEFTGKGGWRVLTAEDLNYSGFTNSVNHQFYGENMLYLSAETNILGKFDENGKLISLGISFWGTGTQPDDPNFIGNTLLDAAQDVSATLGTGEYYVVNAYPELMKTVIAFAQNNGLTGADVIITGHSLGGMAVNSMASSSAAGEWDGFFESSSYVAFASPTQNVADDKVLNIGFENDPVFRVLEGHNLSADSLLHHDNPIDGVTNNIVSFNDFYAGLNGDANFQSLLNSAAWSSHLGSGYFNGVQQILDSEAYKYTHLDSNIIVSTLSEEHHQSTWVQDLHRSPVAHVGTTFIIGSETDDLIKGGNGNDYLSGLSGDDTFALSGGYDVIYGGSGVNAIQLESSLDHYQVIKGNHNEIYFKHNETGMITKAVDIQLVTSAAGKSYTIGEAGLTDGETTIAYTKHSDTRMDIFSTEKNKWLFAEEAIDGRGVYNTTKNSTIVSSDKNDLIINSSENSSIIFSKSFGHDVITGFNEKTTLIFMENENIAANDSYVNHLSFIENSAILTFGDSSVQILGVDESILSKMNIQLV